MNARLDPQHAQPAQQDSDLADRGVLRFITAGSVDDGKSTLIGRLLYDTRSILTDQLAALARAGERRASVAANSSHSAPTALDLSLLTDGLEAEREQGITIDVAYRYFATARRKFIIADTPGHEQYTRNMVTAASSADAAVILIDATRVPGHDLLPQTRRHSALAHLLGIRHLVVAVNKMDLVDYAQPVFERIRAAYAQLAVRLGVRAFDAIPVSALAGDNIVQAGTQMPWYQGPTLLQWLEDAPNGLDDEADSDGAGESRLRFPVQLVLRDPNDGRGHARRYAGRLAAGRLRAGQRIRVLPSGAAAVVSSVETFDGALDEALAGQSVSVRLDREVDISRGDLLVADEAQGQPQVGRGFAADLAWLDAQPLAPQRRLWLRCGPRTVHARVKRIERRLDLAALDWTADPHDTLAANDIARVAIETQHPLAFDDYDRLRATGAFVLIDPATHNTVAAGMIRS